MRFVTMIRAGAAALTLCGGAWGLEIGEIAGPVEMETLGGAPRTMSNYGDRVGTAVVFLSARCPAVREQFAALHDVYAKYRLREVLFVGVCSDPAQSGDELRDFSQHAGSIIQMHRDPDGSVARQFGAAVTPEVFLLDDEGRLIYRGGVGPEGVGLEAAVVALLAGETVKATSAPATGTAIGAEMPVLPIADPYGAMAYRSSFVFEKIPGTAGHHCSTLAEAPNGDLLCLWYGGSFESSDDQALYLSRLPKGEAIWTTPENIQSDEAAPPGNAVIFTEPDGTVGIIWGRMEGPRPVRRGSGWSDCRLFYRASKDNGRTWSADKELPGTYGWLPRTTPITLADGRFALPISGRTGPRQGGSFLLVRSADGSEWTQGGEAIPRTSQPAVIVRNDGSLLSLMRNHPRITRSVSTDHGATWSEPEASELRNPGAGIAMTKLKSGRVLLVFNDTDGDERTPLSLGQSMDDGETWTVVRQLEVDPGEYSYPCIIQASDGTVHVSYTYKRYTMKHVQFNEDWLDYDKRPN